MLENKRWRKLIYDEEKLDELIRENYIHIYKYCFYHLGDKETAEDITQDVFLKFLRGLEDYYEYGKLKNYLYVVAKNTMKDYSYYTFNGIWSFGFCFLYFCSKYDIFF